MLISNTCLGCQRSKVTRNIEGTSLSEETEDEDNDHDDVGIMVFMMRTLTN